MTSMTWTNAPADLLGLGSGAVRPCIGTGIEVALSPVLRAPVTPVAGTGLPFGGTAVRMRPEVRPAGADARSTAVVNARPRTTAVAHNSNAAVNDGTPLGIHSSRRPPS
jgi:hypothetical protein